MMYSDSGWVWLWMAVMMVIFWGTVVAVIVLAIVRRPTVHGSPGPTARDVLDARFARGEIDIDDYRQRRSILDGTAAA